MNVRYKIILGVIIIGVTGFLLLRSDAPEQAMDIETEEESEMLSVEGGVEEYLGEDSTVDDYVIDESDMIDAEKFFAEVEVLDSVLTDEEIRGLIQMREEEKLARDVYDAMFEKWGLNIFTNISGSEQTHTDTIKYLLDIYEVSDPVTNDERGVFTSSVYQELYTNLVTQGETSLVDALIVGATIEDLDIYDLQELLKETTNVDIISAYENLAKGSRNHMRAFDRLIERNGGVYEAQYLSQEEIDEILDATQERGRI